MNNITNFIFDAQDGIPRGVRTVLVDGEIWFVATDVASALGYRDAEKMTRNLDSDEKGTQIVSTLGGEQDVSVINEAGLYAAILKSRRPEAKQFKKWVTSEVLPSIRKTGAYVGPDAQLAQPAPPQTLFLSHAADIMVAADRTFRSAIRSGRSAGLPTAQAIRRANQIALAKTGVNLLDELQAHEHVDALDAQARNPVDEDKGGLQQFWAEYEGGGLAGGACIPLLSTQAYQLYVHWCLRAGVSALTLPRMVHGLTVAGLVRGARKRYVDAFGGRHGPAAFVLPAGPLDIPDGLSETAYLGSCVAQIDEAMKSVHA